MEFHTPKKMKFFGLPLLGGLIAIEFSIDLIILCWGLSGLFYQTWVRIEPYIFTVFFSFWYPMKNLAGKKKEWLVSFGGMTRQVATLRKCSKTKAAHHESLLVTRHPPVEVLSFSSWTSVPKRFNHPFPAFGRLSFLRGWLLFCGPMPWQPIFGEWLKRNKSSFCNLWPFACIYQPFRWFLGTSMFKESPLASLSLCWLQKERVKCWVSCFTPITSIH